MFTRRSSLSKKVGSLSSKQASQKEKAVIVTELRRLHKLEYLLHLADLARSSYYYHRNSITFLDKHIDFVKEVKRIYQKHYGRYGYRRITLALRKGCYEFVSIHPFQDGNGRLSRLLATFLLRKSAYRWIRYVSFEHEIENQKTEYYRVLRACQAQRPREDITEWVIFFLSSLRNIQNALMIKLDARGIEQSISIKEKQLLYIIESNAGIKTSEIAKKLGKSNSTVKRMLDKMIILKLIERLGVGPGSYYNLL